MIINRMETMRAISKKFGTGERFDEDFFVSLVIKYLMNDEDLKSKVHAVPLRQAAQIAICYTVEKECIKPSLVGIIQGVGGHKYFKPLLDKVIDIVNKQRRVNYTTTTTIHSNLRNRVSRPPTTRPNGPLNACGL